jgi:hypothetical protein
MKIVVIKTSDGLEFVGKIASDEGERRKMRSNGVLTWEGDPTLLTVEDPLEIKYRVVDGVPSAVFMKYNSYGGTNSVQLNTGSIVAMYDISDYYSKIYEDSLKTITNSSSVDMDSAREALTSALTKLMGNTSIH